MADREHAVEVLADLEHDRWSRWMRWVYENGTWNQDGSFTINRDKAQRWASLAATRYDFLDDETQEWDRTEARKTLAKLAEAFPDPSQYAAKDARDGS